jgi:hypothetical protein
LFVDYERDITSVTKRGLASNGFEVDAINDPVEALSNFKSGIYDHDEILFDAIDMARSFIGIFQNL